MMNSMFMTRIAVCVHICRSRSINNLLYHCPLTPSNVQIGCVSYLDVYWSKIINIQWRMCYTVRCFIPDQVQNSINLGLSLFTVNLQILCLLLYGLDILLSMIVPRYIIGVDSSMFIYCHGFIAYSNKLNTEWLARDSYYV